MKTYLILTVTVLISTVQLYGQKSDSLVIVDQLNSTRFYGGISNPLYIVKADSLELQIEKSFNSAARASFNLTFEQIDPNWIQSLTIFKGTEATDKFGLQGQDGVVLIELKKGMLDKMPVELSGRFK